MLEWYDFGKTPQTKYWDFSPCLGSTTVVKYYLVTPWSELTNVFTLDLRDRQLNMLINVLNFQNLSQVHKKKRGKKKQHKRLTLSHHDTPWAGSVIQYTKCIIRCDGPISYADSVHYRGCHSALKQFWNIWISIASLLWNNLILLVTHL